MSENVYKAKENEARVKLKKPINGKDTFSRNKNRPQYACTFTSHHLMQIYILSNIHLKWVIFIATNESNGT